MKDDMGDPMILITSSDEEGSGCREKRKRCRGLMVRSKVDEYKEFVDLGGSENLKAMILAEAFRRRRKRKKKKKKSKTEFSAQDDITDNVAKEKAQLGNGEAVNVVEVSKASIEEEKGESKRKRRRRRRRREASKKHKHDEYKRISDLSGFENLKAMIEAEAFRRRKKRHRKKRKGTIEFCARENVSVNAEAVKGKLAEAEALKVVQEVSKPESVPVSEVDEPQNLVIDAAKEIEGEGPVKAAQTTREADDGVNAVEVIDLCLSSSGDDQSFSDVSLGKCVQDMAKTVHTTEATGVGGGVNAVEIIELCSSPSEDDKLISGTSLLTSVEDVLPVAPDVVPVAPVVKKKKKRRKKSKMIMAKDDAKEENDANFDAVLRMLLRKPRYFDPPICLWGPCSICGKESHTAVSCTSRKQNKPCYICGNLDHTWKNCTKGQDCFISNGRDYCANDCPKTDRANNSGSNICLRCGDSGHDMFSCKGDYPADDLKKIQCYVCKSFGHLCCVNSWNSHLCCVNSWNIGPKQVSCYNCGQSGHLGPECTNSHQAPGRSESSISRYKCREGGHLAHISGHVKVDSTDAQSIVASAG